LRYKKRNNLTTKREGSSAYSRPPGGTKGSKREKKKDRIRGKTSLCSKRRTVTRNQENAGILLLLGGKTQEGKMYRGNSKEKQMFEDPKLGEGPWDLLWKRELIFSWDEPLTNRTRPGRRLRLRKKVGKRVEERVNPLMTFVSCGTRKARRPRNQRGEIDLWGGGGRRLPLCQQKRDLILEKKAHCQEETTRDREKRGKLGLFGKAS